MPSRNWDADYFDVSAFEGVDVACGVSVADAASSGVGNGEAVAADVGAGAGVDWDDMAGRSLESGVS